MRYGMEEVIKSWYSKRESHECKTACIIVSSAMATMCQRSRTRDRMKFSCAPGLTSVGRCAVGCAVGGECSRSFSQIVPEIRLFSYFFTMLQHLVAPLSPYMLLAFSLHMAVIKNLEITEFIANLLSIFALIRLDIYPCMAAYIHICMGVCMQVSRYVFIDVAMHHNMHA